MTKILQDFLSLDFSRRITSGKYIKPRPGRKFNKTSITIHSTGNETSTAKNERAWLENITNQRTASWHYVVGEDIIIQAIPDEEEAYHSGVSLGNKESIGIEIVESGDRKKTVDNAIDLTIMLMTKYDLKVKDIKKHLDWTQKVCPRILIDKKYVKDGIDWEYFIKELIRKMTEKNEDYKDKIIDKALELKIITDSSWKDKKDEPVPLWAVLQMVMNGRK